MINVTEAKNLIISLIEGFNINAFQEVLIELGIPNDVVINFCDKAKQLVDDNSNKESNKAVIKETLITQLNLKFAEGQAKPAVGDRASLQKAISDAQVDLQKQLVKKSRKVAVAPKADWQRFQDYLLELLHKNNPIPRHATIAQLFTKYISESEITNNSSNINKFNAFAGLMERRIELSNNNQLNVNDINPFIQNAENDLLRILDLQKNEVLNTEDAAKFLQALQNVTWLFENEYYCPADQLKIVRYNLGLQENEVLPAKVADKYKSYEAAYNKLTELQQEDRLANKRYSLENALRELVFACAESAEKGKAKLLYVTQNQLSDKGVEIALDPVNTITSIGNFAYDFDASEANQKFELDDQGLYIHYANDYTSARGAGTTLAIKVNGKNIGEGEDLIADLEKFNKVFETKEGVKKNINAFMSTAFNQGIRTDVQGVGNKLWDLPGHIVSCKQVDSTVSVNGNSKDNTIGMEINARVLPTLASDPMRHLRPFNNSSIWIRQNAVVQIAPNATDSEVFVPIKKERKYEFVCLQHPNTKLNVKFNRGLLNFAGIFHAYLPNLEIYFGVAEGGIDSAEILLSLIDGRASNPEVDYNEKDILNDLKAYVLSTNRTKLNSAGYYGEKIANFAQNKLNATKNISQTENKRLVALHEMGLGLSAVSLQERTKSRFIGVTDLTELTNRILTSKEQITKQFVTDVLSVFANVFSGKNYEGESRKLVLGLLKALVKNEKISIQDAVGVFSADSNNASTYPDELYELLHFSLKDKKLSGSLMSLISEALPIRPGSSPKDTPETERANNILRSALTLGSYKSVHPARKFTTALFNTSKALDKLSGFQIIKLAEPHNLLPEALSLSYWKGWKRAQVLNKLDDREINYLVRHCKDQDVLKLIFSHCPGKVSPTALGELILSGDLKAQYVVLMNSKLLELIFNVPPSMMIEIVHKQPNFLRMALQQWPKEKNMGLLFSDPKQEYYAPGFMQAIEIAKELNRNADNQLAVELTKAIHCEDLALKREIFTCLANIGLHYKDLRAKFLANPVVLRNIIQFADADINLCFGFGKNFSNLINQAELSKVSNPELSVVANSDYINYIMQLETAITFRQGQVERIKAKLKEENLSEVKRIDLQCMLNEHQVELDKMTNYLKVIYRENPQLYKEMILQNKSMKDLYSKQRELMEQGKAKTTKRDVIDEELTAETEELLDHTAKAQDLAKDVESDSEFTEETTEEAKPSTPSKRNSFT